MHVDFANNYCVITIGREHVSGAIVGAAIPELNFSNGVRSVDTASLVAECDEQFIVLKVELTALYNFTRILLSVEGDVKVEDISLFDFPPETFKFDRPHKLDEFISKFQGSEKFCVVSSALHLIHPKHPSWGGLITNLVFRILEHFEERRHLRKYLHELWALGLESGDARDPFFMRWRASNMISVSALHIIEGDFAKMKEVILNDYWVPSHAVNPIVFVHDCSILYIRAYIYYKEGDLQAAGNSLVECARLCSDGINEFTSLRCPSVLNRHYDCDILLTLFYDALSSAFLLGDLAIPSYGREITPQDRSVLLKKEAFSADSFRSIYRRFMQAGDIGQILVEQY